MSDPSLTSPDQARSPVSSREDSKALLKLPLDSRRELVESLLWSLPRDEVIAINTRISLKLTKDIVGTLPPELAVLVLSKLDLEDILKCSLVSKTWNGVCNEQRLWSKLCRHHRPIIRPRHTTWADLAVHQQLLALSSRPRTPPSGADEGGFDSSEEMQIDGDGRGYHDIIDAQGGQAGPSAATDGSPAGRRRGVRGTVWERSGVSGLPTHAHSLPPSFSSRLGFSPWASAETSGSSSSAPTPPDPHSPAPGSSLPLPTALPQPNYKHLYITHRILSRRLRGDFDPTSQDAGVLTRSNRSLARHFRPRTIESISSVEAGGLPGHSQAIYCLQLISRPMKIAMDFNCPDCHRPTPLPRAHSGLGMDWEGSYNGGTPHRHHPAGGPPSISGRDWLLTGSRDHTLRLWQLSAPSPKVVKVFHGGHVGSVLCMDVVAIPKHAGTSIASSPIRRVGRKSMGDKEETKLMAVTGGTHGRLCLWDIEYGDGTPEVINEDHADSVMSLKADSRHVATCSKDRTVRVFDIRTLQEKLVIRDTPDGPKHNGAINGVALTREYVISGAADNFIRVWDIHTGALLAGIEAANRGLSSIDFELPGPNSTWRPSHPGSILKGTIVAGSSDLTIKTFHLVSHSHSALTIVDALDIVPPLRNMTFHEMLFDEDEVTMMPDPSAQEAGQDPELRIEQSVQCWAGCICALGLAKPDSVRCGKCLNRGHTDMVRSVQLGEQVIYSGSYDATVKVWDRASGRLLADLRGSHSGRVFAVAGDRLRIVSSGLDSRLIIWDLSDGLDTAFVQP